MKRVLALILALTVCLGLFACGNDKKPADTTDNGGADPRPSETPNDDGTTPSTPEDPKDPENGDGTPPVTSSGELTESGYPVAPYQPEDPVRIFCFSGYMFGSFNTIGTLQSMLNQGFGVNVSIDAKYCSHTSTNTTWNLHELFDASVRENPDTITFGSSNSCQQVKTWFEGVSYDYIVLQASRDVLLTKEGDVRGVYAATKLAKLAYQNNPNVRVIIVAPYGHTATYPDTPNVSTHKDHVALINAEAQRTVDSIKAAGIENVTMLSLGDLFESYSADAEVIKTELFQPANDLTTRKNSGNQASAKGAYLTACAIYSAITGRTPEGLVTLGESDKGGDGDKALTDVECAISEADAKALQTMANTFVLKGTGAKTEAPVVPDVVPGMQEDGKTFIGVLDATDYYTLVPVKSGVSSLDERVGLRASSGNVLIGGYNIAGTRRNKSFEISFASLNAEGMPWEYLGATVILDVSDENNIKVLNTPDKSMWCVKPEDVSFPNKTTLSLKNGQVFDLGTLNWGDQRENFLINEGGVFLPKWNDKSLKDTSHEFFTRVDHYFTGNMYFIRCDLYNQDIMIGGAYASTRSGVQNLMNELLGSNYNRAVKLDLNTKYYLLDPTYAPKG